MTKKQGSAELTLAPATVSGIGPWVLAYLPVTGPTMTVKKMPASTYVSTCHFEFVILPALQETER